MATTAATAGAIDLKFEGSLGKNGFKRYVPPVSNPLFNETPYITTELRPLYFYNDIPDGFLTGGGHIDVVAAELRVALTERLGFIASKDGYVDANFKRTLPDESGFANISLGFKYAVLSRPQTETIVTLGIEYEPPTGDLETGGISLQGKGDGLVDVFAAGATTFGRWGLQGNLGANLALDRGHDSSMLHYSVHVDYEVAPRLYPLVEFNGFTTVDEGSRTRGVNFEGVDAVNFGSTRSGTVITGALGLRYRLTDHIIFGAAYENALTDREDLLDWRAYFDVVWHF